MLTLDILRTTHLLGDCGAPANFVEFVLPADVFLRAPILVRRLRIALAIAPARMKRIFTSAPSC